MLVAPRPADHRVFAAVVVVELAHDGTVSPCLYGLSEEGLAVLGEVPGLRVVNELLQLHRGHRPPPDHVVGNVLNSRHGVNFPLSPNDEVVSMRGGAVG